MRCKLINFEGIDGAGKTVIIEDVEKRLAEEGHKVGRLKFPSEANVVGKEIIGWLNREVEHSQATVQMLYATERYLMQRDLCKMMSECDYVLADRYSMSNLAFGIERKQLSLPWMIEIESHLIKPDLNIVIDTDVEVAQGRFQYRDRHESNVQLQKRVRENYLALSKIMPSTEVIPTENKTTVEIADEAMDVILCLG